MPVGTRSCNSVRGSLSTNFSPRVRLFVSIALAIGCPIISQPRPRKFTSGRVTSSLIAYPRGWHGVYIVQSRTIACCRPTRIFGQFSSLCFLLSPKSVSLRGFPSNGRLHDVWDNVVSRECLSDEFLGAISSRKIVG